MINVSFIVHLIIASFKNDRLLISDFQVALLIKKKLIHKVPRVQRLQCEVQQKMEQSQHNGESAENLIMRVLVRDLPMRLFHWLLVIISDYFSYNRQKLIMLMITGINRGRLRRPKSPAAILGWQR